MGWNPYRISFDILALQEVGALPQGTSSDNCTLLAATDFPVANSDELNDYWIIGTNDLHSHLGQALLFDKTFFSAVLKTFKGRRSIGAKMALTSGGSLWILGVHFPHHLIDLQEYVESVREVHDFIRRAQGSAFLIAGDWNSQPNVPNMDQRALEVACLTAEEGLHLAMPDEPTWHNRTYDFFLLSPVLASRMVTSSSTRPCITKPLRDILGSDHHIVTWDLLWRKEAKPPPYLSRFRTGKWVVDHARLEASLQPASGWGSSWDELCRLAKCSQHRLTSKKYVDPIALKTVCQLRNRTEDPTLRASLSRQIIRERREAKAQWAYNIQTAAAAGDTSCIAFLRARKKQISTWNSLLQHAGGKEAAAASLRHHFTQIFGGVPSTQRDSECHHAFEVLSERMSHTNPTPFGRDELHSALTKLKRGKTSGASGMSNEFLVALAQHPDGEHLLLHALNIMYLQGYFHPDLTRGVACLIPKVPQAKVASDIRPILLLEVLQKLFATILMTRLNSFWKPLFAQVGAVPGGQAIEALFAAHTMMNVAKVTANNYLFIKMGLKGAFDNLRHASVGQYLTSMDSSSAWEAERLLRLLVSQTMDFNFMQEEWSIHSTSGTPQGGCHSAGLFAHTLDFFLGKLAVTWAQRGFTPPFDPLWLLLYVDDIMLCFRNWRQASSLMPSFLDTLSSLGMQINFGKSCIIVNSVLLGTADAECTFPILRKFQWCETTTYLNRPFGYEVNTHTLCQHILGKVFAAWGGLKSILGRSHWTNPDTTDRMLTMYVGSVFLWLAPLLYPHKRLLTKIHVMQTTLFVDALGLYIPDIKYKEAIQLVRLRRHVAKRWLTNLGNGGSWCRQLLRRLWSFTGHICRQNSVPSKPARTMLGYTTATHATGLSRPGPWNTIPALLSNFWKSRSLEGDFFQTALDLNIWKSMAPHFVDWFVEARPTNVEFLTGSPWDSPTPLLRSPVAWVRTIFVQAAADQRSTHTLNVKWFDEVEGVCSWQDSCTYDSLLHTFTYGLTNCLHHLAMLYQPFILQIAFVCQTDWNILHSDIDLIERAFACCPCGSWVQLFPLSKKELRHSALRACLDN